MNTTKPVRFDYLDGVRGVAALIVVFGHFSAAFFYEPANGVVSDTFWELPTLFFLTGGFSVQLFFVLSGFVLAYNSFTRKSFLKKQFIKRGYRLFAPVFVSSLLYYIFTQNGWFFFRQVEAHHTSPWLAEHWTGGTYGLAQFIKLFFYDFMFLMDWGFILNTNSSLWTIPIEWYWSYVLFITFLIVKFLKGQLLGNLLMASFVLLAIRFAPFKGVVYGLLFLFGALLAYNYTLLLKLVTRPLKYLLLVAILVLLYLIQKALLPNTDSTPFRWSYLAAALMITAVLVIKPLQNFFSTKVILWLGRISFALYLLHLLVLASIGAWLFVTFPILRSDAGLIGLFVIVLSILFTLAHLFTVYVDEPMMTLFDKVYTLVKEKVIRKNKLDNTNLPAAQ
jgi:peptidoglycan/LPS O-acetylase OafA/YrhL